MGGSGWAKRRTRAGEEEEEEEALAAPTTMRPIGREGESRKADDWEDDDEKRKGKRRIGDF